MVQETCQPAELAASPKIQVETSSCLHTIDSESIPSILQLQCDMDNDDGEESIDEYELKGAQEVLGAKDECETIEERQHDETVSSLEDEKHYQHESSYSGEINAEPVVKLSHDTESSSDNNSDHDDTSVDILQETYDGDESHEDSGCSNSQVDKLDEGNCSISSDSTHYFEESEHSQGTGATTDSSSDYPKVAWQDGSEDSMIEDLPASTVRSDNAEFDEDVNGKSLDSSDSSQENEVDGSDTDIQDELRDNFDLHLDNPALGDSHNSWKLTSKDTTETTEMESFSNLTDSMGSFGMNIIYPQVDSSSNEECSSVHSCSNLKETIHDEDNINEVDETTDNILVLIATQTVDRETPYDQQNAIYTIASRGVDYFTIDASDPIHKELRNELLRISGKGPRYPQFFNVRGDDVKFLGDMKDFSAAIDGECFYEWLRPAVCT
jgi:hypothetical protein